MLLAGCSTPSPASTPVGVPSPFASPGPSATAAPAASPNPIIGKWRGFQRCADIVKALTGAGFTEFIPDALVGNELRPDLTSNDELDMSRPCKGAVDREHFHDFYADGRFDSIDFHGQQVDDNTFTSSPGHVTIGQVTFDVAFKGDTAATVTVKVPADCSTRDCRENYSWAIMVTMPGSTWERVP